MPTVLSPQTKEKRQTMVEEIQASLTPKTQEKSKETVDLSKKSVLIYDFGFLTESAVRLAKDFGKVKYYCEWKSGLPKSNLALVGEGFEGVERVNNFWDHVDSVDLICSFDTNTGDIIQYLRDRDYRTWGAGKAEILESDRWKFRQIQKAVGLPTQNTEHIIGIENLIVYLKKNKDKWVKINKFRGDIETFYHKNYDETQAQFLGKMIHDFGAKGGSMEFIVEDSISGVEPGYDGWVIDGQYPEVAMYGYEDKDTSYIGRVSTYNNLPQPIKEVNDKLKPVFKKLGARTLFSSELRVDKSGKGYMIDPTVRAAMPMMSAIQFELFKNFSEIIWFGAEGKLVKPITTAIYGAGIALESEWAKENWTLMEFPKEIRPWIKLRMATKKDGKYYALPGFTSLGSVIGLGNTIQEAVDKVKENVKKLHAKELWYQVWSLDKMLKETIPEGRKLGIRF